MKNARDAIVAVIDVQERLLPVIDCHEAVCAGVEKLLAGTTALGVPSLLTEQYPEALGTTVESVKTLVPDAAIPKRSFSCCGVENFDTALERSNRRHVLVVGIEAHVCVYQTVRDLLASGYEVSVVVDAIGSRDDADKQVALRRTSSAFTQLPNYDLTELECV